jgi:hypothetical protein
VTVVVCVAQESVELKKKKSLRPETYGVVIGAGQPASVRRANFYAFQACVDDAVSGKRSIVLPPDTIEIDVPNLGSFWGSGVRVSRDKGRRLTVTGAEQNLSRIKCGPNAPSYEYALFIAGPDTSLYLNDLTIEGPSDPGGVDTNVRNTAAISQIGFTQTASGGIDVNHVGEVRLNRVTIKGEFATSIQGNHGDTLLDLVDSDIAGYINGVAWYGPRNTNKRLHARNTYFHDAGFMTPTGPRGHLVYCHPNVSIDFENCRFGGAMRSSIHHYGSSSLPPQYARIIRCTFDDTCLYGAETTNTGSTLIMGCVFNVRNQGLTLKGEADIIDCTFQCPAGIAYFEGKPNFRLNVSGCRFYTPSGAISLRPDASNGIYRISDSVFQSDVSSTVMIGGGTGNDGTFLASSVYVENCTFGGAGAYRAIKGSRGSYYITGCRFSGPLTAVQQDDTNGLLDRIEVTGCNFENTGPTIWAYSGGVGKTHGRSNYFAPNSRQPEANLSANPAMYANVELREQLSPASVASTSTLCVHFNYKTWHVTGAARIDNIRAGCASQNNRMASGPVVLIADGSWSLGNAGNIRPLTTGPRSAGAAVTLVHNPQTDIWSEVSAAPPPAPAPIASAISPDSGTTSGGTLVTVTGTGFQPGARLSLRGVPATSVDVVSSTSITAVTPANSAGVADVVVTNSDGQVGTLASGYTYVAPPPPPDTTPPTVGFNSPAAGAEVTGIVSVSVSASDNVGVTEVSLTADGVTVGSRTASPYTFSWDTTGLLASAHTLRATARDAAGNTSSASISVTVVPAQDITPPSIRITSPANGATVRRTVTVTVGASDNVAVTKVELYVDGQLKAVATTAPFSTKWNTKREKAGSHTLYCKAYDAAGNVGTSASITVRK